MECASGAALVSTHKIKATRAAEGHALGRGSHLELDGGEGVNNPSARLDLNGITPCGSSNRTGVNIQAMCTGHAESPCIVTVILRASI